MKESLKKIWEEGMEKEKKKKQGGTQETKKTEKRFTKEWKLFEKKEYKILHQQHCLYTIEIDFSQSQENMQRSSLKCEKNFNSKTSN